MTHFPPIQLLAAILAMIANALLANSATAQTSSLFGSSGAASQTNRNSSSAAGVTATTRSAGSTLDTTVGGSAESSIDTQAGTTGVNTDFGTGLVGRSDNQGRFAGNQFAGQGNAGGQTNRLGNLNLNQGGARGGFGGGGRGGFGGGGFGGGGNQFFGGTNRARIGGAASTGVFRPQMRIAFSFPKPPVQVVGNNLQTRFQELILRQPEYNGISINLAENGEVTLSGQVKSDDTKRMLSHLMRMEPGVRSVSNQLTIGGGDE